MPKPVKHLAIRGLTVRTRSGWAVYGGALGIAGFAYAFGEVASLSLGGPLHEWRFYAIAGGVSVLFATTYALSHLTGETAKLGLSGFLDAHQDATVVVGGTLDSLVDRAKLTLSKLLAVNVKVVDRRVVSVSGRIGARWLWPGSLVVITLDPIDRQRAKLHVESRPRRRWVLTDDGRGLKNVEAVLRGFGVVDEF